MPVRTRLASEPAAAVADGGGGIAGQDRAHAGGGHRRPPALAERTTRSCPGPAQLRAGPAGVLLAPAEERGAPDPLSSARPHGHGQSRSRSSQRPGAWVRASGGLVPLVALAVLAPLAPLAQSKVFEGQVESFSNWVFVDKFVFDDSGEGKLQWEIQSSFPVVEEGGEVVPQSTKTECNCGFVQYNGSEIPNGCNMIKDGVNRHVCAARARSDAAFFATVHALCPSARPHNANTALATQEQCRRCRLHGEQPEYLMRRLGQISLLGVRPWQSVRAHTHPHPPRCW
jgi:hypothetical protein